MSETKLKLGNTVLLFLGATMIGTGFTIPTMMGEGPLGFICSWICIIYGLYLNTRATYFFLKL